MSLVDGHATLQPPCDPQRQFDNQRQSHEAIDASSIELSALVDRLRSGEFGEVPSPILIRFGGILRDRLRRLHDCFAGAMDVYDYRGRYHGVYPIKVNQQRDVVRQVVQFGRRYGFGIEVGSKPELIAGIAMTRRDPVSDDSANSSPNLIICNGFKDRTYIDLIDVARRLGRTAIPVIENAFEWDLIRDHWRHNAEVSVGETPHDQSDETLTASAVRRGFGARVKLSTRGSGRWASSSGKRSKFGLSISELMDVAGCIERSGLGDRFELLHFHLGSQIDDIRQIKLAVTEAARIYAGLRVRGFPIEYFDVGGGLGIEYGGDDDAVNYTLQEYANNIVYHVKTVCDSMGVPHPTIVSESGRAVSAGHSVLIIESVASTLSNCNNQKSGSHWDQSWVPPIRFGDLPDPPPTDDPAVVHDMYATHTELLPTNLAEPYHDAGVLLDTAEMLFAEGYLTLEQRVRAETMYNTLCRRIRLAIGDSLIGESSDTQAGRDQAMTELSGEVNTLRSQTAEVRHYNFSIFQSLPDAWAINQLFPIMPIERLDQPPTQDVLIADVTCDSDGQINRFISGDGPIGTLPMPERSADRPDYLGVFLVGAYQEILGDIHNLFGDTFAVQVDTDEDGYHQIRTVMPGDTIGKVLSYVGYDRESIVAQLRSEIEQVDPVDGDQLFDRLNRAIDGFTYLD